MYLFALAYRLSTFGSAGYRALVVVRWRPLAYPTENSF